ncbi:hypothetical protein CGMCC3_g9583 [Colletotrichum fructicola]|nr:uncharacterized protein CGMCC3_g9583 [Colletotrichum fructicola]KAE9574402.1 hypothetical protein CGMCC3_g9583 [Colletotrichum fructicola]
MTVKGAGDLIHHGGSAVSIGQRTIKLYEMHVLKVPIRLSLEQNRSWGDGTWYQVSIRCHKENATLFDHRCDSISYNQTSPGKAMG